MTSNKPLAPPYAVNFSQFVKVIDSWHDLIPARIDRSVIKTYNFNNQTLAQMLATLKFFTLIDENGAATDRLRALVVADADGRIGHYRELLKFYPFFATLNLAEASNGQLLEAFEPMGLSGRTREIASRFFVDLARAAQVPISEFILKAKRDNGSSGRRRRRVESDDEGDGSEVEVVEPSSSQQSITVNVTDDVTLTVTLDGSLIGLPRELRDRVLDAFDRVQALDMQSDEREAVATR